MRGFGWDRKRRISSGNEAKLLSTGQTTQYSSELDDGYYKKGIAKSYSVLSTGQYSGSANIDLAHYTSGAGAISCAVGTQKITDSGAGLVNFLTTDVIVTNDPANPGPFTIATGGVAGEIVVASGLVTSTPAGAITISKREAHSNNCVVDNNTGLMWSRYAADKVGLASNGKMPWTGQLYDIFAYAAAANAASLSGYTDWRVPNEVELQSLKSMEAPQGRPDSTAFPGWSAVPRWSSTTEPDSTTKVMILTFDTGRTNPDLKTESTTYTIQLVRGG